MVFMGSVLFPAGASADVKVEVNIGPPVIAVNEPPEVVFVPTLGIYFVPDPNLDIFFYNGFWWSRRGPHWYRSNYYRRGWVIIGNRDVPRPLFRVPRDYRKRFARERHIRYRDWKEHPRAEPEKREREGEKNRERDGERGRENPGEGMGHRD
jgi:hypothetical protein